MSCGSTSETKIPEATEEEKALRKFVMDEFLPMYMEQAGYEMTEVGGDTSAVDARIAAREEEMRAIREQAIRNKNRGVGSMPPPLENMMNADPRLKELKEERQKIVDAGGYELRKKASKKVEDIRSKYGADSPEYRQAFEEYQQEQIETEEMQRASERQFIKNTEKFLRGDFTITPEQEAFVQKHYAPQRAIIDKIYGKVADGESTVDAEVSKFMDMAKQSGMSLGEFTEATGIEIQRGGGSIEQAMEKTFEINRQLMKMGIEDATGEITKRTMQQAAAVGRDPMDPAYQQEIQQQVSREVERGQLQLAGEEARQRTALEREAGLAQLGMEEQAAALRMQLGGGQTAAQGAQAMNLAQLQQAQQSQQLANIRGGMATPLGQQQMYLQERMAQPTTTTSGGGFLGGLGALAGIGTGIAGAYSGIQKAGAMQKMADKYTGGKPPTG